MTGKGCRKDFHIATIAHVIAETSGGGYLLSPTSQSQYIQLLFDKDWSHDQHLEMYLGLQMSTASLPLLSASAEISSKL